LKLTPAAVLNGWKALSRLKSGQTVRVVFAEVGADAFKPAPFGLVCAAADPV